jgi:hypothetical protein
VASEEIALPPGKPKAYRYVLRQRRNAAFPKLLFVIWAN